MSAIKYLLKDFKLPGGVVFETEEMKENYGRFIAKPFEKGYAITIGNSLRRALLSSIPGTAIIAMKIDGVSHEFSTIPGIVEDVTDIVINLKQARIKLADEVDKKSAPVNETSVNIKTLRRGQLVGSRRFAIQGQIEKIFKDKQQVEIDAGGVKLKLPLDDLYVDEGSASQQLPSVHQTKESIPEVINEIDVRGKIADGRHACRVESPQPGGTHRDVPAAPVWDRHVHCRLVGITGHGCTGDRRMGRGNE